MQRGQLQQIMFHAQNRLQEEEGEGCPSTASKRGGGGGGAWSSGRRALQFGLWCRFWAGQMFESFGW